MDLVPLHDVLQRDRSLKIAQENLMRLPHLLLPLTLMIVPLSFGDITGTYETPSGEFFTVFPSGSKKNTHRVWNITNGTISRLTPKSGDYVWKDDNSSRSMRVDIDELRITRDGELIAKKIPFVIERVDFESNGAKLSGMFVFPQKGYEDDAIAQATEIVDAAHFIARSDLKNGWTELRALKRKYKGSDWMKDIAGMPEAFLEHSKIGVKAYFWWTGGFSDPDWDPMTLLRTLDIPIHWTFGGSDTQVPSARCVELLNHEIQHENKPWDIHLLPEADHNLVLYKEVDGEKVVSHFAQGFLLKEAMWVKQIFDQGN